MYDKSNPAHNVVVPLADKDPPLTRKERRLAGITLVGVRYSDRPIGRNTRVQIGDRVVKFKRTGIYREGRR